MAVSVDIRLKYFARDTRGFALTAELILLSSVILIGLIVSMTAMRDAVLCELADVAGSVQDVNQSYTTYGVTSASASVAGMDFTDGTDVCDSAGDVAGLANSCIVIGAAPTDEEGAVTFTSEVFGNATSPSAPSVDSWRSILVVDRSQTFVSTFTDIVSVFTETFSFHSGRSSGIVTPFIVEVLGFNVFEVVAVGDTVNVVMTGEQTHPFSGPPTEIEVAPGATLAFGFIDANPDGSGSANSIVRFGSGNPVYLTGGPGSNQAGSVEVGSAPTPGAATFSTLNRTYQYNIGLSIPSE